MKISINHLYDFKNLPVKWGNTTVYATGTALFDIESDPISVAFSNQPTAYACFHKAKIRDYEYKPVSQFQGITDKDLEFLEKEICENLNSDLDLCEELSEESE